MRLPRLKLFDLWGVPVWADASWLLLAPLLVWSLGAKTSPFLVPEISPSAYWWMAAVCALGVLVSILWREAAQIAAARVLAVPLTGVTIFIFGGVMEDRDLVNPGREAVVALAGAVASLMLGAILLVGLFAAVGPDTPLAVAGIPFFLGGFNVLLAALTLVPAYPLSGGHVLRAFLRSRMGDERRADVMTAGLSCLLMAAALVWSVSMLADGNAFAGLWLALAAVLVLGRAAGLLREARLGPQGAR